ncbi:MAG: AAA family ATPase [Rhizobacter sp.]
MTSDKVSLELARERVASLRAALEARDGRPVRLIETHISWVLIGETLVYKLKKPVRLPFLDFSSLTARRHFCEEELRLNRRLAPSLYLDVVAVRDSPVGPRFGGHGRVLDAAVRMRRFPDGALWSEMLGAGTLAPSHIDSLAQRLGEFHRAAAIAPATSRFGMPEVHRRNTDRLIQAIDAWPTRYADAGEGWSGLRRWLREQLQALAPHWEARRAAGRVRECHGDLHLANVLQLDGEATAFDGIEFDDDLRWIDVLDDIAFLAVDLLAHRQRGLAFRFINACLDANGDHDGLPALRFYMVLRALVRAQVGVLTEAQGAQPDRRCGAADYLAFAIALARERDPRLAITHGLPGSGKTFVSQAVLEQGGAIRVRSDVERKRLFGLGALQSSREHVPAGIYDAAATERTYAHLCEAAGVALQAGWPVIVDAAFLRRTERAQFAQLAASLGTPFAIFDCRAALPVLRQRVIERRRRGADASEADLGVLEHLIGADEPMDRAELAATIVCDTTQALDAPALAEGWRVRA